MYIHYLTAKDAWSREWLRIHQIGLNQPGTCTLIVLGLQQSPQHQWTISNHLGLKKTKNNSYVDHTRSIMAPTCCMQLSKICRNRDILQLGITFYRALNHGISAEAPPSHTLPNSDQTDPKGNGQSDTSLSICTVRPLCKWYPTSRVALGHHGTPKC